MMRAVCGDDVRDVSPGERLSFGRGEDVDLAVAPTDDAMVSRDAGLIAWDRFAWHVTNTGRRTFFVVEAGQEVELLPGHTDRSSHGIFHDETWLRVPTAAGDVAVILEIPDHERPEAAAVAASSAPDGTLIERDVTLTDNELRSVVAVYESFLALPPRYRREPNSYRAAANRIRAEEGKVKADLRRVQEKVARAGGPAEGGSRARDALIAWLASRDVVTRADLSVLDDL